MDRKSKNAFKYLSNIFGSRGIVGDTFRNFTIKETISIIQDNIIKNGISLTYNGDVLHFNCLNKKSLDVSFMFKDIGCSGENAYFDKEKNCIVFNSKLMNDGIQLYESIFHEFTHKIQLELCKHINDYEVGTPEYEYLKNLTYEAINIDSIGGAFGHNYNGNAYIDPIQIYNRTLNDMNLIEAIYAIQMCERSAYQTGKTAREFILSLHRDKEYANLYANLQNEKRLQILSTLRREFGNDLNFTYLCKVIDEAKSNVINCQSPEINNDTQALMMYDIALLLETQNSTNQDLLIIRDNYNYARLPKIIDKSLAEFYKNENKTFARPNTNHRIDNRIYANDLYQQNPYPDAKDLGDLNIQQQEENPKFIVAAIKTDGELAAAEIKCMDVFKEWYHSELNDLPERDKQIVAEVLGDEFALKIKPVEQEIHNKQTMTPQDISYINNIETCTEQYVFDGDISVLGIQTKDQQEELDIVDRNI